MPTFADVFGSMDISTRPKRRRAVALIVMQLERIRHEEEAYLERIPINLQEGNAYAAADDSIDSIISAIITLSDAY